jgi:GNAT superfamily N-acetyltransferase
VVGVSDLEIRPTPYDGPDARPLLDAAHADLVERYGSGDENPVDPREFDPPGGSFLVAVRDGTPVVCGGWRTLPDGKAGARGGDTAEIKRMFAGPEVRGTGAAAALLRALEDSARAQGKRRMVLETGTPQAAAIAFYLKNGYERIENYGYYRKYDDCRSYGRYL